MKWIIEGKLASSSRPGYDGSRRAPVEQEVVEDWLAVAQSMKIQSIICLLAEEQLSLYASLRTSLPEFYRSCGFQVAHVPALDHQSPPLTPEALLQIWEEYQRLPKPVLIHCSAGYDRTGAAVSFILKRLEEGSGSVT